MAKRVLIVSGSLRGGGIGDANDAANHADAMKKAYELGLGL